MTKEEKRTFGGLLEQLSSMRKERSTEEIPEGEGEGEAAESRQMTTEQDHHEMSQISDIFDAVLRDIRRKRPNLARLGPTGSQVDHGRELAELETAEHGVIKVDENMSTRAATKLVKTREASKIEAALHEAISDGRGDTGVWVVCKERIFSMLQYLGEAQGLRPEYLPPPDPEFPALEGPQPPGIDTFKETKPAEEKAPENEQTGLVATEPKNPDEELDDYMLNSSRPELITGPLEIPPFVPVESVIGLLYPQMLLAAFRLLNTHYPGSPLISQFRSTIKAHGRVSTVLGSSTGLFNELIYFHWRGCNDLPGVVSLLREMEVTGVEPDNRTKTLLNSITQQRDDDIRSYHDRRRAGKSVPKDPWWDMAPNRKAFRELLAKDGWASRIRDRVRQQKGRAGVKKLT